MAFTVSDVDDLIRILQEHPEWREKLRPVILGEDLLAVPGRMDRVEAALERLGERLTSLEEVVRQLTANIAALTSRMEAFESRMDRFDGRLSNLEGSDLEQRYRNQLGSWFGRWLRRPSTVSLDELEVFEAETAGRLSAADRGELESLDLVVRGTDRSEPDSQLVMAVEVSYTINADDVERAKRRADILSQLGHPTRAFVGGYRITDEAKKQAEALNVIIDLRRPAA